MKLYELDIDGENSEVYFNSIVNIPAHMKVALKFAQDAAPKRFAFNEEKQIMTGVVIATDIEIPRYNPETKEEFGVIFRKGFADKFIRDYMKKGYANRLNFDHNEDKVVESAYLIEMYQIDKSRGNSVPVAFEEQNLQDGSIIASYHIPDKSEWEAAKQRGGFSIEGVFDLIEVSTNENFTKMSLLEKLGFKAKEEPKKNKQTFSETAEAFAEATLEDGTVIYWDGELAEGTEIFVDVEGVMTPAPDGTHVTSEGVIVETSGGVVASVTMPEIEEVEAVANEFETATNSRLSEIETAIELLQKSFNEKFEAQAKEIKAKDEAFAKLRADFEAVKKIAPEPQKQKFGAKVKEVKEVKSVDLLAIARHKSK